MYDEDKTFVDHAMIEISLLIISDIYKKENGFLTFGDIWCFFRYKRKKCNFWKQICIDSKIDIAISENIPFISDHTLFIMRITTEAKGDT